MKLSKQLVKNLKDLGFEEVKPNIYCKQISENTVLYRDYRKDPVSYAYFKKTWIDSNQFKETKAIEKIENLYITQNPNKISIYA